MKKMFIILIASIIITGCSAIGIGGNLTYSESNKLITRNESKYEWDVVSFEKKDSETLYYGDIYRLDKGKKMIHQVNNLGMSLLYFTKDGDFYVHDETMVNKGYVKSVFNSKVINTDYNPFVKLLEIMDLYSDDLERNTSSVVDPDDFSKTIMVDEVLVTIGSEDAKDMLKSLIPVGDISKNLGANINSIGDKDWVVYLKPGTKEVLGFYPKFIYELPGAEVTGGKMFFVGNPDFTIKDLDVNDLVEFKSS